jgi:hypothetical protein
MSSTKISLLYAIATMSTIATQNSRRELLACGRLPGDEVDDAVAERGAEADETGHRVMRVFLGEPDDVQQASTLEIL